LPVWRLNESARSRNLAIHLEDEVFELQRTTDILKSADVFVRRGFRSSADPNDSYLSEYYDDFGVEQLLSGGRPARRAGLVGSSDAVEAEKK
jgi:hypothetical protein